MAYNRQYYLAYVTSRAGRFNTLFQIRIFFLR